jgi:hypothetical protein
MASFAQIVLVLPSLLPAALTEQLVKNKVLRTGRTRQGGPLAGTKS